MKPFILITLMIFTGNIFPQWVNMNTNITTNITDIAYLNYNTGFATTFNSSDSSGIVYRTLNGGQNWNAVITRNVPMNSVYQSGATEFYIAANSYIWLSWNNGITWLERYMENYEFYDVRFQNQFSVYTCGYNKGSSRAALIRSTDRGVIWNHVFALNPGVRLYSIRFPSIDTGYTCGQNGVMLKVIEGVTSWTTINSGTNQNLYSLHFFNGKTGFAAGGNSTIIRTTNGGYPWYPISTGFPNITFRSINFIDENTGYLIGSNGFIARSTDKGLTWVQQTTQTNSTLNGISFLNYDTIYAAGSNAAFLRTDNGGNPIGISIISSEPVTYSLMQNFPNPFNPETNIKFNIAKSSGVSLIIYDSIGKVIEQLFNKELAYGSYSIIWDASNYPSGVYFYKLTAGEFSETKKMLMIK